MTDRSAVLGALKTLTAELPADQLAWLIGELEGVKASAWARLTAAAVAPAPKPGLVDAAEMAGILGTPENWVRDKARAGVLPFIRMGHYVRFEPPAVIEAARKLRLSGSQSHNGQFCAPKKRMEKHGGSRPVSNECPTSSAAEGSKLA